MTPRRRLVPFCAAVLLMAANAAPALAQSAGDDQYSDPLAGSGTTTTTSKPPTSTTPMPGLSATPQAAASPTATAQGTAAASASAPAAASAGQLPRTGAETWLVALLGGVLVLTGIGLRLRTADGHG